MNRYMRNWAAIIVVAAMCGLAPSAGATGGGGSKPDVIIEWNQLLQQHIGGAPFMQMRGYSMMHIAMADAVVAIEGRFDPFHAKVWASRGASAEAAAAQAGHDVFVVLVTTQVGKDAAAALLQSRLSTIPPGLRAQGVNVGKKAAASILAWRLNDGYATANPQPPAYLASTLPGIWKATASGPFQFSEIGNVEPFGMLTVTQFLSVPFPQLESAAYADTVNEVKKVAQHRAAHRSHRGTDTFRAVVCRRRTACRRHECVPPLVERGSRPGAAEEAVTRRDGTSVRHDLRVDAR